MASQDKSFQAQAGVYFQMDTALYNDDRTDFSSGTELRRGRIFLAGTVLSDWDYKFEADFGGTTQGGSTNEVTVTDAYVRYTRLKPYAFTAGNFKIPFSLESVGSAKYLTFMEHLAAAAGAWSTPATFLETSTTIPWSGPNWRGSMGPSRRRASICAPMWLEKLAVTLALMAITATRAGS